MTLAWDPNPEPDLAGYRLHYGLRSRAYVISSDVGKVTTNRASLPFGGETFSFAVSAYNTSGLESDYSNEVSYRPPVKAGTNVSTNRLALQTAGNQAVQIAWQSPVLNRATTALYIASPPAHGRIYGPPSNLLYEPGPSFQGSDQCRLILADRNENVLKLEVSIELVPVGDPIDPDTTIFQPSDDAFLQNSARFNDGTLKVEAGSRVSYLKFAVSGLSGTVQSATLRLQENGDTGNGTVRVYRGSHNSWTETTLSAANAPAENGQVGVFSGAVGSGQVLSLDVTPLVTGNGTYSVILRMDPGGNDIWFGSDESTRKPQLVIQTSDTGTTTFNLTVNQGTGDGGYSAGTTVNIAAAAAPSGQVFDRWTGDVSNVENVNAASTSIVMPTANATLTATYKTASGGGSFSFLPTDDAYLENSARFNDGTLKVEAGRRVSYLKFAVSRLSGTVQSAKLRLQENGDIGNGTVRVYRGSHNNWTETTLSTANAPVESGTVGTFSGAVGSAQVLSLDVTPLVTGNGTYSAILKMDSGGNDIWFGSEESSRKPQLIIQTSGTGTTTQAIESTVEPENMRGFLETIWDPSVGQWLIGWSGPGWVLQEARNLDAPWTDVTPSPANPYRVRLDGEHRFFRLRAPTPQ